jgi:hypothetical protein
VSGETERAQSAWTTDTVLVHLSQRLDDAEAKLIVKIAGIDRRHDDLHKSQQLAIDKAFAAQEKAVEAALSAQEKAVNAALNSQREALNKADAASEKRFASVNEFRQTLSDQNVTFARRSETEQLNKANADKIDIIMSRLDRIEGRSTGIGDSWAVLLGVVGGATAIAALMFAFVK